MLQIGHFGSVVESDEDEEEEEEEEGDDDSFVEEIVQKSSRSPDTSQALSSKKAKKLNASTEVSPASGKNKGKSPKSKENKTVTQVKTLK